MNDWKNALDGKGTKPQVSDIAQSISAILAVKDEEELVSSSIRGRTLSK